MNGSDFIDLAEDLAAQTDEAALRSAISRAYYGAFHIACALLSSHGVSTGKHDAHIYLQRCGEPTAVKAGKLLADLQSNRIKADYKLDDPKPRNPRFAGLSVAQGISIRKALAGCESNEARAAIQQGLSAYISANAGGQNQ